jgi:hypothetical protein
MCIGIGRRSIITFKLRLILKQITTTLRITLKWRDEYLTWNPNYYTLPLTFKPMEIWTPDIVVSNLAYDRRYDYNKRFQYLIVVQPDGAAKWTYQTKFVSTCPVNQDMHPYEHATCSIEFRSSAHDRDRIQVKKGTLGVDSKLLVGAEFDLIRHTIKDYERFPGGYMETGVSCLSVKLDMKRNSMYYMNKIIFPYCIFYIITIFTFLVPVESGEKKSYCTSIFISALIFLKENYFYIPKSSMMPIITVFFSINLVLLQISIISSIIIYAIYYMHKRTKSNRQYLPSNVEIQAGPGRVSKKIHRLLAANDNSKLVKTRQITSDGNRLKLKPHSGGNLKLAILTLDLVRAIKYNLIKNASDKPEMVEQLDALENLKSKLNAKACSKRMHIGLHSNASYTESDLCLLGLLHTIKHRLKVQNKLKNLILFKLADDLDGFNLRDYCDNYEVCLTTGTFRPYLNRFRINNLVLNSKWKQIAIHIDRILFFLYACVAPSCLILMYIKISNFPDQLIED